MDASEIPDPKIIKLPWLHVKGMAIRYWGDGWIFHVGTLSDKTYRHELIHIIQEIEEGMKFYLIYWADWMGAYSHLIWYLGLLGAFWAAYARIRAEQEAFAYAPQDNYLERREPHAWKKFKVKPKEGWKAYATRWAEES